MPSVEEEQAIVGVLRRVLDRLPQAPLTGVGPDGWFMAPPASLAGDHPRPTADTALDLVVDADRAAVIAAWARTRVKGTAQVPVHRRDDPERTVMLLFADLRATHGSFVMVMVPPGELADESAEGFGKDGALVPRYCAVRRNELAFIVEAGEAAERMLGWTAAELAGRRSIELIHPDDHGRAIDNWLEMLGNPGGVFRWRGRYQRADGSWLWLEIANHNRLTDPAHGDVLTEMIDISDEMATHDELRASEELFRELTEALPVGVVRFDARGHEVFANRQLRELLDGAAPRRLADWKALLQPGAVEPVERAVRAVVVTQRPGALEVTLRSGRVCHVNLRSLRDAAGRHDGLIACVADVTESSRLRDELRFQATTDALTGCRNRAATLAELEQLLHRERPIPVGVVFVDLDGFKAINDRYGHAAGDELLTVVGRRLIGCAHRGDVVGRVGGDEFVVLHPGGDAAALEAFGGTVRRLLNAEAGLTVGPVALRASVGVALVPPGGDAGTGLAAADAAMYRAKRQRRATVNPAPLLEPFDARPPGRSI